MLIAEYIVGTPSITVARSWAITLSSWSRRKRGNRMISKPQAMPTFITPVMPKTWNRGRAPTTFSWPGRAPTAQRPTWRVLVWSAAWLSMAPLGSPVVPPVYCSTAMSASGSIATGRGLPSLSISFLNLTWRSS